MAVEQPSRRPPNNVDQFSVHFPPFPPAPEGITIIPFSQFKEVGIQLFSDGDVELDGLGIATIELRVKHNSDEIKTDAAKKRKKTKQQQEAEKPKVLLSKKEWWEEWAEGEHLRIGSAYDPSMTRTDRIFQAARDFVMGRRWPPNPTGVRNFWDQFRLFAGLLGNTPIWHHADQVKEDDADADADVDDSDGSDMDTDPPIALNVTTTKPEAEEQEDKRPPLPRPLYSTYGKAPPIVETQEEIKELLGAEKARKAEKLDTFLDDPEKRTKIFLSSYMKEEGLIWADRNLIVAPHLLSFFYNFILRNTVFPEAKHQQAFRRALDVVEHARKELPLTSKIAKVVPDEFARACKECWGRKADGYERLGLDEEGEEQEEENGAEREQAKIEVVELDAKVEAANQIVEDNMDVDKDTQSGGGTGWGTGWGQSENDEDESGMTDSAWASIDPSILAKAPSDTPWIDEPTADLPEFNFIPSSTLEDWLPPKPPCLLTLLGPTTLPLIHTTGIVECSLRRIVSVTLPSSFPGTDTGASGNAAVSGELGTGRHTDLEAVEDELAARFARVVMAPWIGWDEEGLESNQPRVLKTSRGAVAALVGDASASPFPTDLPAPHDLLRDPITLLVDPVVGRDLLSNGVGMGLYGTWVQVARIDDVEGEEGPRRKKQKLSSDERGSRSEQSTRYWYLEELRWVLPSYYCAMEGNMWE